MNCRLEILAVVLSLSVVGCGPKPPAAGVAPQAPAARAGGQGAAVAPGAAAQKDPDAGAKDAVRAWLKENLDDPTWEEVKWWRAIKLHQVLESRIKAEDNYIAELRAIIKVTENAIADEKANPHHGILELEKLKSSRTSCLASIDEAQHRILQLTKDGPRTLCGMKLRTKNQLGAMSIRRELFEIKNGQANPILPNDINRLDELGWGYLEDSDKPE